MKNFHVYNAVIATLGLLLASFTGDAAYAVACVGWYLIGRDLRA